MISGLVIRLTQDDTLADTARRAVGQHASIEMGSPNAANLPVVLETATAAESQELTDWLKALPGVEHVDVTFTCFDNDHVSVGDSPRTAS